MTTRSLFVAFAVVALAAAPRPAHACGGFFCSSQPIAQSGEKILFSMEGDGSITAYIQIAYTGPSTNFAWILPVPSAPDISVGTQALLDQLAAQTTPSFSLTGETRGTCHGSPICSFPSTGGGGCGCAGSAATPSVYDRGAASDAGSGIYDAGVEVLSREVVGPYDTAVLTGSDTTAIHTWLTDNGYLFPDEAIAGLAPYVAKHDDFVVLKLTKDADTGDLAPVVLHYTNGEPCIPIILTAIATVPDMPIVGFFLADGGVGSTNYAMTEVDLGQRGLWNGSLTWTDATSYAVDDAGGHAFVTDFRGPVPSVSLELPSIEDLRTVTTAQYFMSGLQTRGYNRDPMILPVLEHALPPPTGVTPRDFYNCITTGCGSYDGYLATLRFDASALVDAIEAAITTPRHEATLLLARHTTLTRLFTTLSASEMTVDPEFAMDAHLPSVAAQREATVVTDCSAEYVEDYAPQHLEVNGVAIPWRDGHPFTTDDAYCHAIGAMGVARPSSSVSGLVGPSSTSYFLVVAGLAGVLGARRLRRRRAR